MTDDIVQLSGAEVSVLSHGVSRRAILQLAGYLGAAVALGPSLAACAGPQSSSTSPTGAAGGTISVMLNRNLVSLDNKLNQYDAAVTVQRAVRQALTRIGLDLKPELVLAKSFELTSPTVWTVTLRDDIKYSDNSPVTVEDVETALKLYFQVAAGDVASQFPEQPKLAKTGDRSFTLTTVKPVITLDALMSNILITPAAANKAEELREGIGSGPFTVAAADSGTGTYKLVRNENYWGEKALLAEVNIAYQEDEGARVIAITSGQTDVRRPRPRSRRSSPPDRSALSEFRTTRPGRSVTSPSPATRLGRRDRSSPSSCTTCWPAGWRTSTPSSRRPTSSRPSSTTRSAGAC